MSIPKESVLILGGQGYLGQHLKPKLLNAGYNVVIGDINSSDNFSLSGTNDPQVFNVDVTSEKSLIKLLQNIRKQRIRLAHIVNTVGGLIEPGLTNMFQSSADEITKTLDLNLKSQLFPVRFLGTSLIESQVANKSFVLISSINAHEAWSIPFYSAAKGALHSFIRPAAMELGRSNVRINIVTLGTVRTPSTERQPKNFQARAEAAALGHLTSPNEAADGILACLSLTGMTGQEIVVDCGQSINPSQSLYDQRRLGLASNP